MQGHEKYSPVQIRNPLSQHHLVRLLPAQRINLVFTKPEFQACSVNISGDFLRLDDVEEVRNGWVASISQLVNYPPVDANLFLGEINIFGESGIVSTLCVVTDSPQADYFRVIQPTNNNLRVEPHQVLDVLFYAEQFGEEWDCSVGAGGQLRLEQIDYCSRYPSCLELLAPCKQWPVEEHYFRFRLDAPSIELVQGLPQGRYDGGSLSFFKGNGNLQRSTLRIVYNWREKKSAVYKALLLPKNRSSYKSHYRQQKKPKEAMQSTIVLRKIECEEMESGCNVIFARCY